MHNALLVSEILSVIFHHVQNLDQNKVFPTSKRTLSCCARTCKAWTEPALELLWERLNSIMPLLQLFSESRLIIGSRPPKTWKFKHYLRPGDWKSFSRYSPFVRHLTFREDEGVACSALVALAVQRPAQYRTSHLLPNLVFLNWIISSSDYLALCAIMVSPSLTSLTLTMKGAGGLLTEKNDVIGGLLCTTANIAQGLKELHLDIEGFWLVKDMVDILISFHELEVLTLEVGSPGAFIARDLKAHPTIRKLKLNIQDFNKSITHKFKPLTYHEGDYPALEELTIVGDWYATNLTLRSIVPAPTRTLTVCSFSLPNLRRFAICLEMIVEASPRLEVLQMAVCIPEGGEDQVFRWPNYISSSALLSLTALKQLVELSLDIGVPVELDDEDAIYLISSLPKLRVCVICPGFWCERSRITPSFLGWVARNAKRITSLGLPIYMDLFWQPGFISSFSPVESSQLAPVPALQTLYLSGPMPLLSTADEIAAYLLSLFPALETIHSTSTVYDGSLFFWYEVAAALERRREPMSESSEYFDCVEDEVDGDVFGDEDEEGEWMRLGADLKAEEWIRNWGRLGV